MDGGGTQSAPSAASSPSGTQIMCTYRQCRKEKRRDKGPRQLLHIHQQASCQEAKQFSIYIDIIYLLIVRFNNPDLNSVLTKLV